MKHMVALGEELLREEIAPPSALNRQQRRNTMIGQTFMIERDTVIQAKEGLRALLTSLNIELLNRN